MRTKLVKIVVILMAFAFYSAGVSMAKDWKGGHQTSTKGHAYGHYKRDKHHKFDHKRHYGQRHIVKHHHYYRPRPVVVHHHHYSTYAPYPYYAGQFVAFSVMNPNVAFSIAVGGH